MSRTESQRHRIPRYHRFAENDGRVKALADELDDLRARYDQMAAMVAAAETKPDLAPGVAEHLKAEAKARCMKPAALVKAIVEAVTEDNLFAALLDG